MSEILMQDTGSPLSDPRPPSVFVPYSCDHCGAPIEIELKCWQGSENWLRDTPGTIDRGERLCLACNERRLEGLERAREYESDIPAPWFDSTYAGERWSEE